MRSLVDCGVDWEVIFLGVLLVGGGGAGLTGFLCVGETIANEASCSSLLSVRKS